MRAVVAAIRGNTYDWVVAWSGNGEIGVPGNETEIESPLALSCKKFGLGRSSGEWRAGCPRSSSMKTTDVDYSGLLLRVARLERQNLFWKIAVAVMLLAAVFSHPAKVAAQMDPTVRAENTTVEARAFLLRDSAGHMRGKMTVDGDRHPLLEFYDADGRVIWSTDSHVIPTK